MKGDCYDIQKGKMLLSQHAKKPCISELRKVVFTVIGYDTAYNQEAENHRTEQDADHNGRKYRHMLWLNTPASSYARPVRGECQILGR